MKTTILILGLIIICYSCKNTNTIAEGAVPEKETIEIQNDTVLMAMEEELDSLYNTGIFNGFTATIVDSTGIVYNKGFGYADIVKKKKYTNNTIINIASVSKTFIGVALLKAQELKLLNLDEPINTYLPFKVNNPNYPDESITVRQLATHTSSIVDNDIYIKTCYVNKDDIFIAEDLKEKYGTYYQNPSRDWLPLDEYLSELLRKDGKFYDTSTFAKRKPGDLYEYSNIGAALCALVIESVAKKPFHEFTKEFIFNPLKMNSTSWIFEEVDSTKYSKLYFETHELPYYKILSYPDGALITSSTDLSYFLIDLIKGYSGNGTILNQNSYKELFKPQLEERAFAEKQNKNEEYNTGLFFSLEPTYNVIGHTGGDPGTNSFMFFNTVTGKGRILITNTDSNKENSDDVFYGIWNTLDN